MKSSKKARELIGQVQTSLYDLYTASEAENIGILLIEHIWDLSRMDVLLNISVRMDSLKKAAFEEMIRRLKMEEPIQYILGKTEFYGYQFHVAPTVLIPRPETEELVRLIIDNTKGRERILDLGTGSGCIPISLKLQIPNSNVIALDVSEEAIEVAAKNAKSLNAEVEFLKCNILESTLEMERFDIMVSNPPYVRNLERGQMNNNVLNYEPHLALFVEDDDALIFYRRIVELSQDLLRIGGKLFFEINEALGGTVLELMESGGFQEVKIIQDLHGKNRMVWGIKS